MGWMSKGNGETTHVTTTQLIAFQIQMKTNGQQFYCEGKPRKRHHNFLDPFVKSPRLVLKIKIKDGLIIYLIFHLIVIITLIKHDKIRKKIED